MSFRIEMPGSTVHNLLGMICDDETALKCVLAELSVPNRRSFDCASRDEVARGFAQMG